MLTATQIKWASTHDWYRGDNGDGTITVREEFRSHFPGGKFVWAWSFAELRAWAGY